MPVTLKGFSKHYRKLKTAHKSLSKLVPQVLGKYGAKMVRYARQNHKFQTQTGQLERSITYKVDRKSWRLEFYIDGVRVYSRGWNYGWIQNDGTAQGYHKGEISPLVSPKGRGKGIKADDFMGRAWKMYVDDLTAELEGLLKEVLD